MTPAADPTTVTMVLEAREPLPADAVTEFLTRRSLPGVEAVSNGTYRRVLDLTRGPVTVALTPRAFGADAVFELTDLRDLDDVVARCRRLLDLDREVSIVDDHLRSMPELAVSVARSPGRRSPGAVDGTEMVARAIAGQQVSLPRSLAVIAHALDHLIGPTDGNTLRPFPSAAVWATLDPVQLSMPRARARAFVDTMALIADGTIDLSPTADPDEARARLLAVKGIGPWTASYVAMRALGQPDEFLPTDVAMLRGLASVGGPSTPSEAAALAEHWRPWRSYALHHLWSVA